MTGEADTESDDDDDDDDCKKSSMDEVGVQGLTSGHKSTSASLPVYATPSEYIVHGLLLPSSGQKCHSSL